MVQHSMTVDGQTFDITKIFPLRIRECLAGDGWQDGLEEIRIRVGQPVEFFYDGGSRYLSVDTGSGIFVDAQQMKRCGMQLTRVSVTDIAEMLNYISQYSLYAYREELKQGYITIEGGHRIGLAGEAWVEQGKIAGIHHVSFLNIRIAHEKKGCAKEILPCIRCKNSIHNTLFLSPPGAGKTTLLRDCIRLLSEGDREYPGMKVCVVDERSEIAACHLGVPQNDIGPRTDVLDGCGKPEGILLLLRSMSPQILAVDELGSERDFVAVEQAVYSGSKVIGTIHAGDIRELAAKPHLRRFVEREMFHRYVQIQRADGGGRSLLVFDSHMEKLC